MTPEDQKAMIRAAKKGDVPALRLLVEKDRSLLDARDRDGSTPLHCTAWKGHLAAVGFLLDAGADIQARSENDHYGDTPLHAAAHGNQKEIVKLLIERGADVRARNMHGRTPLDETGFHNATAAARLLVAAAGSV